MDSRESRFGLRTILIFGGKSPIAIAIAKELSKSVNVLVLTRNQEFLLDEFIDFKGINLVEGNLTDINFLEQCKQWLIDFKVTDICFAHRVRNHADNPIESFEVEVLTPYKIIKEIVSLQNFPEIRVVVLTSPAATKVVNDQPFMYHANKAALANLVRYCAVQYANSGLLINAVAPGSFVQKERSRLFYENNPEITNKIQTNIPGSKFTKPEDIANYVNYLFLRAPNSINGTEVVLDSGLTLIEQSNFLR